LAFGHGTGSELRQPLGYAMVGGLALSQLLTLYTTPVVYLYLDRVQVWLRGDNRNASPSGCAWSRRSEGESLGSQSTHLFRSFPRKRESRTTCSRLAIWVPAFAGTNGACVTRHKSALQRDRRAHEIALAELDPAVAQDVVGGGAVEIEVRQRVGEQQRLAGELARRPARERDLDRLVLAAVDLHGL